MPFGIIEQTGEGTDAEAGLKQKEIIMGKNLIVVDIDGTISKVGDRIKHILGDVKDWDTFYSRCGEDDPIYAIIDLVVYMSRSFDVVFCTGRMENTRNITENWIAKHFPADFRYSLFMRPDGDYRHDIIVKPQLISLLDKTQIKYILEDRNTMVAKWREMGFTVLQPSDGDF